MMFTALTWRGSGTFSDHVTRKSVVIWECYTPRITFITFRVPESCTTDVVPRVIVVRPYADLQFATKCILGSSGGAWLFQVLAKSQGCVCVCVCVKILAIEYIPHTSSSWCIIISHNTARSHNKDFAIKIANNARNWSPEENYKKPQI
jgi:hypothetical protein